MNLRNAKANKDGDRAYFQPHGELFAQKTIKNMSLRLKVNYTA